MPEDILDTIKKYWAYQEMLRYGPEEERRQRVQEKREIVVKLVKMRFPELVPLAEEHLPFIHEPEELHKLILKLFAVQTVDEARRAITETDKD